jgi:5-methylcytosine-specific restriction endonuclease McrA
MQKHTQNYLKYFGLDTSDMIFCEVCNYKGLTRIAVDIHHILPRSKFGSKTKNIQDRIDNLIALCRDCHNLAHAEQMSKLYLKSIHEKNIKS